HHRRPPDLTLSLGQFGGAAKLAFSPLPAWHHDVTCTGEREPARIRRVAEPRSLSMKDTLRPGVSLTSRITVDRDRTIAFMGEEARVYATPRLLSDIEMTCRQLLLEHCD